MTELSPPNSRRDELLELAATMFAERGLRCPDDLSVVGIFSEDFGKLFSLPYTAVETSPNKLGRLAVQALVQRMLNPSAVSTSGIEQLVAPHITDRGSTR